MTQHKNWREWMPPLEGEPFVLCREFPAQPGLWNLRERSDAIRHWEPILRGNAAYLRQIVEETNDPTRIGAVEAVLAIYLDFLDELAIGSALDTISTIHEATILREHLLRAHGLADPYLEIKNQEARAILPAAIIACENAWADGANQRDPGPVGRQDIPEPLVGILAEMFAGNLFDLGSKLTQEAFRSGTLSISDASEKQKPWVRERLRQLPPAALDLLLPKAVPLTKPAAGKVLLFADNAGPDFLLGILPAALYWGRSWEVWIVVNSDPASSDITFSEASSFLSLLSESKDSAVARAMTSGRLNLVASGTGTPGIDLRHVGPDLNEVAKGSAWIVLEGQGRGVETNWSTTFSCPAFHIAMVKDKMVAEEIGLTAGTPVLRFEA